MRPRSLSLVYNSCGARGASGDGAAGGRGGGAGGGGRSKPGGLEGGARITTSQSSEAPETLVVVCKLPDASTETYLL